MSDENQKNVWIVYNDTRKDYGAAEKYGKLRDIFSNILPRNYNGPKMIEHVRYTLRNYRAGDYILVVGDPVLVAMATAVALEHDPVINYLRWDNFDFNYTPFSVDFD